MTGQTGTINFTPSHQRKAWIPLSCLESSMSLIFKIVLSQFTPLINLISQIARVEGNSFDE